MSKLSKQLDKYGDWALVAGASEGLGLAFAETLAAMGKNVIMIARRAELLNSVAEKISRKYDVEIRSVAFDLSAENAYVYLMDLIRSTGCRLIVYNAAYGPVKMFVENTLEELDHYINLNARTLLKLAWAFAREQSGGLPSGLLVMSSMAGLRGTQMVAPYAATKAFDWNLAESLHYELRDFNIDVSVMCAGPVKTPGYLSTKPRFKGFKPTEHDPELVAREALGLLGRKALGTPGVYKFNNFILTHLLPRRTAVWIVNRTMRRIYGHFWKEA